MDRSDTWPAFQMCDSLVGSKNRQCGALVEGNEGADILVAEGARGDPDQNEIDLRTPADTMTTRARPTKTSKSLTDGEELCPVDFHLVDTKHGIGTTTSEHGRARLIRDPTKLRSSPTVGNRGKFSKTREEIRGKSTKAESGLRLDTRVEVRDGPQKRW